MPSSKARKFLKEPKIIFTDAKAKHPLKFDSQLMNDFENYLKSFVENIFNKSVTFSQTDDLDICKFCGYNSICNR